MSDVNENSSEGATEQPGPQTGAPTSSQGESAAQVDAVTEDQDVKEPLGDDAIAAIFEAGREAGRGGLDPEHCPYSEGDERRKIWLRGHGIGVESVPPKKLVEPEPEIDLAMRIPDRFLNLVIGRTVYYTERVNLEIRSLPAIITRVMNQAEGSVNLQVIRDDAAGMMFTKNVPYSASGDARKTWRWPQGEEHEYQIAG